VAFTSTADNLVPGDTNGVSDVFLRDLQAGTTTLVSVPNPILPFGNYASSAPVLSADGRYVFYHSQPSSGSILYYIWRDMQSASNVVVVTNAQSAAMSLNGRYVAYAASLNGPVVVWDSQSATTVVNNGAGAILGINFDGTRVAAASGRSLVVLFLPANTNLTIATGVVTRTFQFSADNRYLAYLAISGFNYTLVYVYDFQVNSSHLVSQSTNAPAFGGGASDSVAISPDGRFVAYRSVATNLVAQDTNGAADVFLYDQLTSATTLVSANPAGNTTANAESRAPVFTGDSQILVFQSWASDLVAQNSSPNGGLYTFNPYAAGAPR